MVLPLHEVMDLLSPSQLLDAFRHVFLSCFTSRRLRTSATDAKSCSAGPLWEPAGVRLNLNVEASATTQNMKDAYYTGVKAVLQAPTPTMSRSQITSSLRGQQFILPDFDEIYRGWSVSISPHINWLQSQVECRIVFLLSQATTAQRKDPLLQHKKLKAIDVAFLVSSWWPNADPEVLLVLSYAALWLFMWDDEIDCEDSELGRDAERAQKYREDTLRYVKDGLDLWESGRGKYTITPTNILITSFGDIGVVVRSKMGEQRERLYREIEYWILSTEVEQARRSKPSLPEFGDYLATRMGTSGVRVLCILFDVLTGPTFVSTPPMVFQSKSARSSSMSLTSSSEPSTYSSTSLTTVAEDLELMTHQTNLHISLANDILSVKKELAVGAPDSTIPILWLELGHLNEAVETAVNILQGAKRTFEMAEQRVLESCIIEERAGIKSYIDSLKTMCSGNIAWSMRSKRYGMHLLAAAGEKVIVL